MNYISELNALFDNAETRSKPLSQRKPITDLLDVLLEEIIEDIRPDLVLEVGAFEAAFSQKMKRKYPDVPVIALEANPRVFEYYSKNIRPTGVEYKHIAAGAMKGHVDIFIPTSIAGKEMPQIGRMGSLLEVSLKDSRTERATVPCDTIDNIISDIDFGNACIWVDVEGFVEQVLSGAKTTLSKTQIIYAELESSPVWSGQTLAPAVIDKLEKIGFVMMARDCQKWFQFNAIFVRAEIATSSWLVDRVRVFAEQAKSAFLTPGE